LRNFDNFLSSYMDYAVDGFCPDEFHFWTGVSVIAGALERKVWTNVTAQWTLYPNLYVLLISNPAIGKSSAGNKGVVELLREVPTVNILPTQLTEARMVELMNEGSRTFDHKGKTLIQSPGYFYASEASNSLKVIPGGGDIKSMFTDWYDCGKFWDKGTVKNKELRIKNVCFNLLAGCTFQFLSELIPEKEILGGFASRMLYVVHDTKFIRKPVWGESTSGSEEVRRKLLQDLTEINSLSGPFSVSDEFKAAYEEWFPKFDEHRQGLKSEKMQAFLGRTHVNIIKLSMVLSVARNWKMELTLEDWKRAKELIMNLQKKLPKILNLAGMESNSQKGINMCVIKELAESENETMEIGYLRRRVLLNGFRPQDIDNTLSYMHGNKIIKLIAGRGNSFYQLAVKPEDYL